MSTLRERVETNAAGGNPYARTIHSCVPGSPASCVVDVYSIGAAYPMTNAVFHAAKKLLMAGERGDKSYEQDLREAMASIQRELDDVAKGAGS